MECRKIEESLLHEVIKIVKDAGEIIISATQIEQSVEEKSGHANFVTAYDKKVQDFLFMKLAKVLPEAVFIGEEEEEHAALPKGYAFVIDPIDGTTNFMKGYCTSCISVGLLKAGKPEMGVVYNPYLKEVFHAVKGQGAFRNGKPIHVSNQELSDGIVIFGTAPYYEELSKKSFEWVYRIFQHSLDVRRSGSAAIDLCNIAAGRAELFFELCLSPWDFAAGSLIVQEAGGQVISPQEEDLPFDKKCGVIAGNPKAIGAWKKLKSDGIL